MRSVLLISDDAGFADQQIQLLTRAGFEAATVPFRGMAGEADSAPSPKGVVLLDMLSQEEPFDLQAFLDRRPEWEVPLLLLIAAGDEPLAENLPGAVPGRPGAHGYLTKPFTDRELLLALECAFARHEAGEVVRKTEDRFFASSIDLLCFLNFNGYFRRLSPSWERTLGFTLTELTSRPFIEFVHPDDRERTLAQNAKVRAGGQALAFQNRYLCKDGSFRWLHWNATPDPTGRVIYSVARDITDQKEAEAEREELVLQLQASLKEVAALREILPICSYCKKIRDDEDYWHTVESYILRHTTTRFSHGICPTCMDSEMEPHFEELEPK